MLHTDAIESATAYIRRQSHTTCLDSLSVFSEAILDSVSFHAGCGSGSSRSSATPDFPGRLRALFNGKDFTGLHGMPHFNLMELKKLTPEEQKKRKSTAGIRTSRNTGRSRNGGTRRLTARGSFTAPDDEFRGLRTPRRLQDHQEGDSGVYLKATPQVQIWDYTEESYHKMGADKGSGVPLEQHRRPPRQGSRGPGRRADHRMEQRSKSASSAPGHRCG